MNTLFTTADHLLPVAVTVFFFAIIFAWRIGIPYLTYVHLVADADSEEGINILAKYLAERTGGRRINVSEHWESFIPAAKSLHKAYVRQHTRETMDRNFG